MLLTPPTQNRRSKVLSKQDSASRPFEKRKFGLFFPNKKNMPRRYEAAAGAKPGVYLKQQRKKRQSQNLKLTPT